MKSESDETFDLRNKRLSLIDVSFEDDSLYSSPSRDFSFAGKIEVEDKIVNDLEFKESGAVEASFDSIEERREEGVDSAPRELSVGGVKKTGKYNLRKSLAWDSAFFTSAGFLEPEELSSMMVGGGEEKIGKCKLPGIEEEAVYGSTDSISTLASDNLTLETIDADLFGDIRASIQKSSNSSKSLNSIGKLGSGLRANQEVQSNLGESGHWCKKKAKIQAVPRKPNAKMQGSGRVTNQIVNSSPSTCKPPKVAEKISPNLTSTGKRVSLGSNRGKVEEVITKSPLGNNTDSAKEFTSKGIKPPTTGASRNALPKPRLPSRTSLGSTKTLPLASNSVDSSESLSSNNSSKSSSSTAARKVDSRTGSRSSSLTVKSTLRVTSRTKVQLTNSRPSPHLKSVTRLSSSISPASSISEWSSGSLSPTSTLNKGSNSSRTNLEAASSSRDGEATQVFDNTYHCGGNSGAHATQVQRLLHEHPKRVSAGGSSLVRPDSVKPTGLRMPSPKLGFFDGVKSALRTPNKSPKSNLGVPGNLPKVVEVSASPNGGSNESKCGKLQPTRTVLPVRGTKVASQQPAAGKEPRSPLQQSSNAAPKISSASRKAKQSPSESLKKVAQKQTLNDVVPETDVSLSVLIDNINLKDKDIDVEIAPAIREHDSTLNSSPTTEFKDINSHKETQKEHINDDSQNAKREVNCSEKQNFKNCRVMYPR